MTDAPQEFVFTIEARDGATFEESAHELASMGADPRVSYDITEVKVCTQKQ
jgi:hypothetical protein